MMRSSGDDQKYETGSMSDLLLLGISHYPPLNGPDSQMSGILKRMLKNPHLPAELQVSSNWPAAMQQEWSDDEGLASATRHRAILVDELRRVRQDLDAFKPDFVLMWGDDQYENFREDIVPPYCVCAYPNFEFQAHPNNVWGESPEKTFSVAGHAKAGKMLATALISQGFDTAYAYRPLHHSLGHAFTNAVSYLDYDRCGFPYPILPVTINCYGRKVICQRGGLPRFDREVSDEDFDPPAPTPQRLFDLGAATARILLNSPYRVALLASSGWSHAFLTGKNQFLYPDTKADQALFDALRLGNFDIWRNYASESVEASGQQEVLNWMCLVGAMKELGRMPSYTKFVDTWIFNSSKVFLIA
jgi:Catalytic LigB subunit of aromatic ring-opening dioxygenase